MSNPDPLVGTVVGGYRLEARLGEETLGRVYRAVRVSDGSPVGFKVLYPHLHDDPQKFARFQREVVVTALSRHPNVVRVISAGREDPIRFLVFELFPSRPLSEELQRGPLDPDRAAALLAQTAQGLAAGHALGIVHRHVQPQNILIGAGSPPVVKLRDFGFARYADDHGALTPPGVRLGSVQHLAPETVTEEQTSAASDVYALGVVLYQALTGRDPFFGTPAQVLDAIALHPFPIPGTMRDGLPPWADDLVARFTASDPSLRPTAAEAAALLTDPSARAAEEAAAASRPSPGQRRLVGALLAGALIVNASAAVGGVLATAVLADAAWAWVSTLDFRTPPPAPAPEPPPPPPPPPPAVETVEKRPVRVATVDAPPPPAQVAFTIEANLRMLVRVDGVAKGFTPATVPLTPGAHTVEVMLPGRPDTVQRRQVRARAGHPEKVAFTYLP